MLSLNKSIYKIDNFIWSLSCLIFAAIYIDSLIKQFDIQQFVFLIIQLYSAVLFLIRNKIRDFSKNIVEYVVAFLSTYIIIFIDFKPFTNYYYYNIGISITLIGSLVNLISIHSLGKNLAICPNYRGVSSRYMYRFVRHPVYLSYILLDIGLIFSHYSNRNLIVIIISLILYNLRIAFEEKLLLKHIEYVEYKKKIKYRLVPFIY